MRITKAVYEKYVETVPADTILFREGEAGNVMYIIITGEVEIVKATEAHTSKTLIHLQNGDIFGEMALIEKKKRSATAITVKTTRLLVMNEQLFYSMIEKNPDFAKKMIRILSERLRRADILIESLMNTNKEKQLLNGIVDYAKRFGIVCVKGMRINKNEFLYWAAQHLGIPHKEIYKMLGELTNKKWIYPGAAGSHELVVPERYLSSDRVLK